MSPKIWLKTKWQESLLKLETYCCFVYCNYVKLFFCIHIGLRLRANALDLSTVQALNMLSVCWGVVERGVQMTSTMTQHVEQSEDFTKAHDESWLRIFGYALHCAWMGSTCWALMCKCTGLVEQHMDDHETKKNIEPSWAKSLTSFKFDSTRLNTARHLSTGRSNALNMLSSTCWAKSLRRGQIQWICTML